MVEIVIELIIFTSIFFLVVEQLTYKTKHRLEEESKKLEDDHPEIPWH